MRDGWQFGIGIGIEHLQACSFKNPIHCHTGDPVTNNTVLVVIVIDSSVVSVLFEGIARTLLSGEPLYQHIRTLVRLDGEEPFWVSYERLLTRHELRGGAPVVISDVNPTQYVDIPLVGTP